MHAHASRFSQGCKVYEGKGQNMERVRDVGWRGGEKGWAREYREWRGKEEKAKRERHIYIYSKCSCWQELLIRRLMLDSQDVACLSL